MSIRLTVESKNFQGGEITIPIAAQRVFTGNWLLVAEKLNLEWVPLFEGGISITEESAQIVIDELATMREFLLENSLIELTHAMSKEIIERIEKMIPLLRVLQEDPNAQIWIG
jgi:hypothetical protein